MGYEVIKPVDILLLHNLVDEAGAEQASYSERDQGTYGQSYSGEQGSLPDTKQKASDETRDFAGYRRNDDLHALEEDIYGSGVRPEGCNEEFQPFQVEKVSVVEERILPSPGVVNIEDQEQRAREKGDRESLAKQKTGMVT